MTLQDILGFVNFVIRKSQAGEVMTPEQYNVLLSGFNTQIFQDEFNQVEVAAKAQGNHVYRALHSAGPLLRLIKKVELYTAAGVMAKSLLPGYVHWTGFITRYAGSMRDIDVLTEEELNNKRSSLLEVTLAVRPVCVDYGDELSFWPKDVGVAPQGKVEVTYLRMPNTPYYDYCFQESTGKYYYMPVGSAIKTAAGYSDLWLSGGTSAYVTNVYHPSVTPGTAVYSSATVELDWDARFHMRFVQALLQAVAPSLDPNLLNQYTKEMPR